MHAFRQAVRKYRVVFLAFLWVELFTLVDGRNFVQAYQVEQETARVELRKTAAVFGIPLADLLPPEPEGSIWEEVEEWVGIGAEGVQSELGDLVASAESLLDQPWGSALAYLLGLSTLAVPQDEAVTVLEPLAGSSEVSDSSQLSEPGLAERRGLIPEPDVRLAAKVRRDPTPAIQRVERQSRRIDAAALPPSQPVATSPALAPRRAGKLQPAEITALANNLGSPAAILRYVHDTIIYDPKHGADSPPLGTLWEQRGTAWDQAWLLQELLLALGVDARLEWGEVEITPDLLTTLAGVDDPIRAADLLTTAGLPVVLVVGGNEVIAARMPHVWVKAHLDYIPNRGLTDGTPDTWIRLDPSLKDHPVIEGQRLDQAVSYLLAGHLAGGSEQSPRQDYEGALIAEAGPTDLDALKPLRTLLAEDFPFVPGTLRAKVLTVDGESETVPDPMQVQLEVTAREVGGGALLSWATPLSAIYGEALELRWRGATSADQANLDLYGGIYTTPPYEIELAGELRLGGAVLADGGAVGGAEDVELTATITPPGGGIATTARWDLFAGEHAVVGFDLGHAPQEVVERFGQQAAAAATANDREANQLAAAAATYFRHLGEDLDHLGALRWHRVVPLATAVLAVQRGAVSTFPNGSPETFSRGPLSLDLGAMQLGIFPADGVAVDLVPTIELLGSQASVREGEALASVFGGVHPTAVGFLKQAVREGQNLSRVDGGNLGATLADAELGEDAEAAVRDAVERGRIAWIAEQQIEINGWRTSGYILQEPDTGLAGYHVAFERRISALEGAVTFHAPRDLDAVTAPTEVVATIDTEGLQSWTLSTRPVGSSNGVVLATGSGPVENTTLGQFDPTLLLNGLHELILAGTDVTGQTVTGRVTVSVEGNMKIGHFTLSFVDLAIPVSGLDIEVVRTYDSRQRLEQGDFGQGWTLDIRQGSYRNNRPPGDGWQIPGTEGPWGLPCQTVHETKSHLTTVRLSDQEVYRFRLVLRNPATVIGGCFADAVFEWVDGPLPGTTLEVLGNNQVFVATGSNRAVLPDTQEPFVPEDVKLVTRDGRIFHLDLADGVTHVEDLNGNFLEITPEGITHSSGKGVEFERDAEGRIVTITDPMGNSNRYDYNASGDLVTFTDRVDAVTRFTYTGEHYLEDIENALGVRAVRTEYDEDGRVARMIDADGKVVALDHDLAGRREVITNRLGFVRVLEYDERGNIVREVDELGNVTTRTFGGEDRLLSETDPLENTTTFGYDAQGDLVSSTDPLGNVTRLTYDGRGNPTALTDPRGKVTTSTYDSRGNLFSITNSLGAVTTFAYDTRGQRIRQTDALGHTTTFAFDVFGNLTSTVDALGHETTTIYDANGNVITQTSSRTAPDGSVEPLITRFTVDALGRVTTTTLPDGASRGTTYDALGAVLTTVDPLGRETSFLYDGSGRQTGTVLPDGTSETREFDVEGRMVASVDRAGRTTSFAYDAVGRLIAMTRPDGTTTVSTYDAAGRLVASTDARGSVTTYGYDAAGRQISVIDALGNETRIAFDAADNPTAITDSLGHATSMGYDDAGRRVATTLADGSTSLTEYDALGRRVAKIDAAGISTEFAYDALGRLVLVRDALGGETAYGYDDQDNRTLQTDANDHTTRFEYDRAGRQIARILPDGTMESFAYDAAGNRIRRTDFNGDTTLYSYDENDRLTQRAYPDGSIVSLSYTPTGKRASVTDSRGVTSYSYDPRDQLLAMSAPEGWTLRYAWDAAGNRTRITADLGTQGTLTTTYTFDAVGRLATVTDDQGGTYTYGYDPAGRQTSLDYPNGVRTTWSHDPVGRLLGIHTETADGSVIQNYAYTLGPTGNRQSVLEQDGTTRAWEHDALYRLIRERVTDDSAGLVFESAFTYDPVGNRLEQVHTPEGENEQTIHYLYDERDRLLSETIAESVVRSYDWDANGNLISKDTVEGTTNYGWDFENRLTSASLPDGTLVGNLYDADGVWTGSAVTAGSGGEGSDWRYVTDTSGPVSQVVADLDGSGHLEVGYVRGHQILQLGRNGSQRHFHHGPLGSTRALTDSLGTVADQYEYDGFGQVLEHQGSDPNRFRFLGESYVDQLRLVQMRARWLEPERGQFLSMDPWTGEASEPATLHRYLYATANPINNIDPTGWLTLALPGQLVSLASRIITVVRPHVIAIPVALAATCIAIAAMTAASGAAGLPSPPLPPGLDRCDANQYLVRFGPAPETVEQLAADAAKAEATGQFPHGVSTFLKRRISGSDLRHRSAVKSVVESFFSVRQTGRNRKHYTVILPKPVTEEVAMLFNSVFTVGR